MHWDSMSRSTKMRHIGALNTTQLTRTKEQDVWVTSGYRVFHWTIPQIQPTDNCHFLLTRPEYVFAYSLCYKWGMEGTAGKHANQREET